MTAIIYLFFSPGSVQDERANPASPTSSLLRSPANENRQSWDRKGFPDRGCFPNSVWCVNCIHPEPMGSRPLLAPSGKAGRFDRRYHVRPRVPVLVGS